MKLMQRTIRADGDKYLNLYHLCYYFSAGSHWDENRKRVIAFKNQDERAIRQFIALSIGELIHHEMDRETIVIRAIGHDQLTVDYKDINGINRLGSSITATFDLYYYPELIYKSRAVKPLKTLNFKERQHELQGVYAVKTDIFDLNGRKIFLIDDVVTTGLTVGSIASAIFAAYPKAKVTVFALAWTPTASQQAYLREQKYNTTSDILSEPEAVYRKSGIDVDYESGETNVSLF